MFTQLQGSATGVKLRIQAVRRADRPPVHANGAVESALAQVRNLMEPRMYSYKNRARTNRVLELVRLSMPCADDCAAYTAAIRPPTARVPRGLRQERARPV
ncbi:hypothetical protein FB472_2310 [Rhodoglobus vestalii]|uniref:Uncharacterized protein n=1 Tax=Rhodoglobus vestalii TaxID=193384 RepID=A0A8H2PXX2_9MICO|nr:hypothetical protein FB472_2310 [Rhodoglobus vestalii]